MHSTVGRQIVSPRPSLESFPIRRSKEGVPPTPRCRFRHTSQHACFTVPFAFLLEPCNVQHEVTFPYSMVGR